MKLFETSQIAKIDQYTINNEPIADIDLMERASGTIAEHLISIGRLKGNVAVFCGPGNNGGDGLAVARLLAEEEKRFQVDVFVLDFGKGLKGSAKINLERLNEKQKVKVHWLRSDRDIPNLLNTNIIVDALFGSGLNRPLEKLPAKVVHQINGFEGFVVAIDIPSGLMGENNGNNIKENIVKADLTLTFQFPKLSFLLAGNNQFVGEWAVKDIGLHPDAISEIYSPYYLTEDKDIAAIVKKREKYAHKGNFGHALFVSGSYGKIGAAILGARGCLRAGVGLLTVHVPHSGYLSLQTAVPEAMTSIDDSDLMFTGANNLDTYNAIGVGPGIGKKVNTVRGLNKLLEDFSRPMVIDADAVNIIGENREMIKKIPPESILTPHPKEFERLTEPADNSYDRLSLAISFAQKHGHVVVLKGAHTQVVNNDGEVWFNTTGNPGMATAGSGDVLTGIILGLLAQGYSPFDAARLGVYLHGLSGDIAMAQQGVEALIASDIIDNIGEAFKLGHK